MEKFIFVNPFSGVNQNIPNLGLAYAATKLAVRVIDLNTRPRPQNRYLDIEAETLGISVQSRTLSSAKEITERYKKRFPAAKVKSVSGFLDVLCCYPYLDFPERIHFDLPFSDSYPFPDYELFDSFSVFQKKWQRGKWPYIIMTSQGCPYSCSYCSARGRKWLYRSAKNAVAELAQAQTKWGIKSFDILDDCFNINKPRVLEFCAGVQPLKMSWACANGLRADLFDEEMAKALSEAGCTQISFGVESSDQKILRGVRKGETIEQIENAIKLAKKYAKRVSGFFIIGLPGSSFKKDLASLKWAQKLGITAHFSYYVPSGESLKENQLFYGPGAEPTGEVYPIDLQKKIYRITASMRPGFSFAKVLRKVKGIF